MLNRRTLLAAGAALPLVGCATTTPRGGRDLRVLSFNIWHDMQDWAARRPLLIQAVRDADVDVIGLQEVLEDAAKGLPNQADTLAQALNAAGLGEYRVVFSSTDPEGAPRRYGNAILSRLPIVSHDMKRLAPLDDSRTALRAVIQVGQRRVTVVNTHFHHTPEGGAIRATQAADLLSWIPQDGAPLIVMGDFNAPLTDSGLASFGRPRFVSALPAGGAETTLNPAKGHNRRVIDHIFVEPEAFIVRGARLIGDRPTNGEYPSDHFGVVADLSLR
jgi:endonuclease/exonuclease/phosphatase family metal-dependent hydrolase